MTVVRRIARPMLAAIFVTSGLDALRHPAARAQAAAPLVKALAGPLNMPDDPEMMVRANGATMLVAGTLLGLGRFPRVAALALASDSAQPISNGPPAIGRAGAAQHRIDALQRKTALALFS